MLRWKTVSILDVYTLAIGLFLFLLPWLARSGPPIVGEADWGSSVLIVALSIAALFAFSEWEEWGKLVLGLCLAASPWLIGTTHSVAANVSVGAGLLVAYLAAMELWLVRYADPQLG